MMMMYDWTLTWYDKEGLRVAVTRTVAAESWEALTTANLDIVEGRQPAGAVRVTAKKFRPAFEPDTQKRLFGDQ